MAKKVEGSFQSLTKPSSRPQLIWGTIIQILQQFTGINVIMFYAPVLFQTMGFGSDASLLSAVVTGLINVVSTFIAIFTVDRCGRKVLLIEAAIQMLVAQCTMGITLAIHLKSTNEIPKGNALFVVFLVSFFVAGFAWSWGPLGWLIPSEIYPLETQNADFFFAVGMNMLCNFIIAQCLDHALRHEIGDFFFFSAWIVVTGCFATFMLPVTKGIPIDEMNERDWKKH
ncbi:LOW QUALITY PROTEIN: hypothetical protein EUGRSUZ_B02288, partial [Eucalyptus grandis]